MLQVAKLHTLYTCLSSYLSIAVTGFLAQVIILARSHHTVMLEKGKTHGSSTRWLSYLWTLVIVETDDSGFAM